MIHAACMHDADPIHRSRDALIIPADRLSEVLDIQMAQPGWAVRSSLYAICVAIIVATVWAFFSTVNVTVQADGLIRPREGLQGYPSPFTGTVDSVYVDENQPVCSGDTVLVFSSSDLDVEIQQNAEEQLRLRSEIADLQMLARNIRGDQQLRTRQYQAERRLTSREGKLMEAEISVVAKKYSRMEQLYAKGLSSEEEFDRVRSELELLLIRKERYTQEKGLLYQSKLSSLQQDLARLEKTRLLSEDGKKKRVVVANVSGHILQLRVRKSHIPVTSGQELFVISPDSNLQVELFVAANDIGMMKEGLHAQFRVEALPFQEWGLAQGRVLTVSKDVYVEESGGRGYFKIVASMNEMVLHSKRNGRCATLAKGMMVRASIVIGRRRLLSSLLDKTVDYFALR